MRDPEPPDTRVVAAPVEPGKPPGWVIIYLVACAVLTFIGLIVLFLEHRILGSG